MGILDLNKELDSIKAASISDSKISPENFWKAHDAVASEYRPKDEEKDVRALILRQFAFGDMTMQKPRPEFNDMSVISRMQIDQMSFNTYQPNNGESVEGDQINYWKSRAMKPIVRNKCMSIAAHATARLLFPKVFAYNEENESEEDAAIILEDLMEWAADKSNYSYQALYRVIAALTDPASIGYTEYTEVYRKIKDIQEDGSWKEKVILDEELSGFQDTPIPCDQMFIENFYEPDIQKQGWLIWRRVRSYSMLEMVYQSKYENFKYVKPGVQLMYNDANQSFYQVYDTNMRPEMCEEVIYWNRNQDLKIIMINGVMLTPYDNPNPRLDKLYPFDKFGYEIINSRCFYYKSLAFKLQPDANIVNTLYPMIIDGTYLNLMPPMINVGGEAITSDVIVPGSVTTLSDPNSDLKAINTSNNLKAGMDALFKVEESISDSSQEPLMGGGNTGGTQTAYEISRIEQNANTVLGLFVKMIADHVKQFGRLRLGDIMQYLTIADVDEITGETELIYKTFVLPEGKGRKTSHKIEFSANMPSEVTPEQELNESGKIWDRQGGLNPNKKLYIVNPELFRKLYYKCAINPDILNPRSEDLERAYKLEIYDRAIASPLLDQEEVVKDFLLGAYSHIGNADKYINKNQTPPGMPPANPANGLPAPGQPGQPGNAQPKPNRPYQSPLNMLNKTALPQSMSVGALK